MPRLSPRAKASVPPLLTAMGPAKSAPESSKEVVPATCRVPALTVVGPV